MDSLTEHEFNIIKNALGIEVAAKIQSLFMQNGGGSVSGVTAIVTTKPTVTSDTSHGYAVKNLLYDSNTGYLWICLDATNNAAVWQSAVGNPNP